MLFQTETGNWSDVADFVLCSNWPKRSDQDESESKLHAAAEEALKQIREKDYIFGMKGRIFMYGIAFKGMEAKVVSEKMAGWIRFLGIQYGRFDNSLAVSFLLDWNITAITRRGNSVGRVHDWRSWSRWFEPGSRHHTFLKLWYWFFEERELLVFVLIMWRLRI